MRRATIAAISLLLIALAGWAHASEEPETAEICQNMEEYGDLNKAQKSRLKTICNMMPLAQKMEKEKIHRLPGCKGTALTKSWLRREARHAIKIRRWDVPLNIILINNLAFRAQTCRLAHEIHILKDELLRLKENEPEK